MDLFNNNDDNDIDLAVAAILNAVINGNPDRALHNEEIQRIYVDINGWRRLNGAAFIQHFRMSRPIFQRLVNVGNHLVERGRIIWNRTPFDLCLLFAVWVLGNPDTFRNTSMHFSTSQSSIHFHYAYIIEALRELAHRFIKWPNEVERDVIKSHFKRQYGYPGVMGCIDGTHIDITAHLEQPRRFVNRHHQTSITVQAVSDHKLLIRDLYAGQPGSVGDARTFSRSPLSPNLFGGPQFVHEDEHSLGDGAYPLLCQLMKPYIDDGMLARRERRHNYCLSACRASVERCFCLLQGKWRRLKHFLVYSLEYCIDHIVASVVLHNFMILDGEDCHGIAINGDPIRPTPEAIQMGRKNGALKRELFSQLITPDDEM